MADDPTSEVAAGESKKEKPAKTRHVTLLLLVLFIATFSIGPVGKFIYDLIERSNTVRFSTQLLNYLPEKTDVNEVIYNADGNGGYRVYLIIKTDLSPDSVNDFYNETKITPLHKGDIIFTRVIGPHYQDKMDFGIPMYEDLAVSLHGEYRKFQTNSSYSDDYFIVIRESELQAHNTVN